MSSNAQVRLDLREIRADEKLTSNQNQRNEDLRLEVRKPKMCRNKIFTGELLPWRGHKITKSCLTNPFFDGK